MALILAQRHTEALAATPAGSLDRDGEPDRLIDDLAGVLDALNRLGRARNDRDAGGCHQLARLGL